LIANGPELDACALALEALGDSSDRHTRELEALKVVRSPGTVRVMCVKIQFLLFLLSMILPVKLSPDSRRSEAHQKMVAEHKGLSAKQC
jgi:hypothetical protein